MYIAKYNVGILSLSNIMIFGLDWFDSIGAVNALWLSDWFSLKNEGKKHDTLYI